MSDRQHDEGTAGPHAADGAGHAGEPTAEARRLATEGPTWAPPSAPPPPSSGEGRPAPTLAAATAEPGAAWAGAGVGAPPPPPPPPRRDVPADAGPAEPSPAARGGGGRGAWLAVAVVAALVGAIVGGGVGAAVAERAGDDRGAPAGGSGTTPTSAAPAGDGSMGAAPAPGRIREILEQVEPGVAAIKTEQFSRGRFFPVGAGTGVVLTPDGEVLTNAHVVRGANRITVTLSGETQERPADLVGADPAEDLAVLKIRDASGLPTVRLGSSAALRVGDQVVAIGNALGLPGGLSVTQGIVSAVDRSIGDDTVQLEGLIQTDAAINPGNSGGPLVNASGEVVGINTAVLRANEAEGIGFAIPVDRAKPIVEQLRTGEPSAAPFVGISFATIDADALDQLGYDAEAGAFVQQVVPGGPAARAGLRPNDVVVRFGDRDIKSADDLFAAVREHEPGDQVPVVVVRGDERRTLTIEVGRRSEFVTE